MSPNLPDNLGAEDFDIRRPHDDHPCPHGECDKADLIRERDRLVGLFAELATVEERERVKIGILGAEIERLHRLVTLARETYEVGV